MCNNKLNNGAEAPNSGGKIGAASPEFGQSPLLPNVQAEPWRGMARMMLLGATVVTVLGIGSSAWFGCMDLIPWFEGIGMIGFVLCMTCRLWNRTNELILLAAITTFCSSILNLTPILARIL